MNYSRSAASSAKSSKARQKSASSTITQF